MPVRREVEHLGTARMILTSGTVAVPNVSTATDTGCATPIAYASCTSHRVREPRRDDVLGDPARGVARRPIDLGRILAAERAAAVATHPAVRVDDDLAAGETGVALRSADDEAAGRIDVVRDHCRGAAPWESPARSPAR